MDTKDLVVTATTQLFAQRDPAAVDQFVSANYRQHSTLAADGPGALRDLVANLPDGFRNEPARVISDGDLVALHGVYHGFGPDPLVAFDIFRVADGKIAEHWDALQPVVATTASGRSQNAGPTEITDLGATEANRAVVAAFAEKVLKGADYSVLTDYISTEIYHQHNPEAADGLDGFGAAAARWAEAGKLLTYTTIHKVIAEGDFVLTQSEGVFGVPVAYYDLFRLERGKIVEHWDVIAPIPAEMPARCPTPTASSRSPTSRSCPTGATPSSTPGPSAQTRTPSSATPRPGSPSAPTGAARRAGSRRRSGSRTGRAGPWRRPTRCDVCLPVHGSS
jgi:predicted SnoaL-like aldol condensation-catalyzing enzyme